MKKIHLVTQARLWRVRDRVLAELRRHGFHDGAVAGVEVRLVPLGAWYGWQCFGTSGEIGIPAVSLARLRDWWDGGYIPLADVLRHEYGHAIADTHRGLVLSRPFVAAFGASHASDTEWEYDPEIHVSEYAATAPAEDFAETFMFYLRHAGRLPPYLNTSYLRSKWTFIRRLGRAIRAGRRRWR